MGNRSESQTASPDLRRSPSPSREAPASAQRGAALLARYGGASGPTGVAALASTGSPTSLASFMGGKAAGPRLGKLAGDGKSAPPEAFLIDQSRHALPGMTRTSSSGTEGQKPLAAFLAARADKSGAARSATVPTPSASLAQSSPASTTTFAQARQAMVSANSNQEDFQPVAVSKPTRSSTSERWQRESHEPQAQARAQPELKGQYASQYASSPSPSATFSSTSPTRTSIQLTSPYQQESSAPPISTPSYPRSASPTKFTNLPSPAAGWERNASPVKNASPPKVARTLSETKFERPSSPIKNAHSPTRSSNQEIEAPPSLSTHQYGVASPVRNSSGTTAPFSPLSASTSSPAFSTAPASDRAPTASLTRLNAKKMVGQRIREAQERAQASGGFVDTSLSPIRSPPARSAVKGRWPEVSSSSPSLGTQLNSVPSDGKAWLPGRLGTALPGLTRAKSGDEVQNNPSIVPTRSSTVPVLARPPPSQIEADTYAPPVRLPGMGGETLPQAFSRSSNRTPSPTKQVAALPTELIAATPSESRSQATPLQHVSKSRARPPKRTDVSKTVTASEPVTQAVAQEEAPSSIQAPLSAVETPVSVESINRRSLYQNGDTEPTASTHDTISSEPAPPPKRPVSSYISQWEEVTSSSDQPSSRNESESLSHINVEPALSSTPSFPNPHQEKATEEPSPSLETRQIVRNVQEESLSNSVPTKTNARRVNRTLEKVGPISFDRSALLSLAKRPILTSPSSTISLEVLSISSDGTTTTLPLQDARIVYEKDIRMILHRFKASNGLVSTSLHLIVGTPSTSIGNSEPSLNEAVEARISELSKRFNAQVERSESPETVMLLGGLLIKRDGSGKTYDDGDTAMYNVRAWNQAVYIDQVPLVSWI